MKKPVDNAYKAFKKDLQSSATKGETQLIVDSKGEQLNVLTYRFEKEPLSYCAEKEWKYLKNTFRG